MKRKAGKKPKAGADDRHIGERVRDFRINAGLTQDTLGEAIGVSFQQVQKNENSSNRLNTVRLMQIRKALGVPMVEFVPEKYR